ncbi:hypothetical protein CR513_45588, partial [Mucuna pruriens]
MKVVVDDVDQQHEELGGDVNQLKEKMGEILEILQNLKSRKGTRGNTSKTPQVTLDHPPRFTPNQLYSQVKFPPYGLPHNYTPATEENQYVFTINQQCEGIAHARTGATMAKKIISNIDKRKRGEANAITSSSTKHNEGNRQNTPNYQPHFPSNPQMIIPPPYTHPHLYPPAYQTPHRPPYQPTLSYRPPLL